MSAKRGFGSRPKGKPFLVGLTGNFGTGKSTVGGLFRKKGARVLDSDRLAHEVFRKGNRLYRKLRALFPEIPGELTRGKVARIVFRNARRREKLESLVHPYVFERIREVRGQTRQGAVILEVPLLFESGFDRACRRTIVVKAKPATVLVRLKRKGFSRAEVLARWEAQMPLEAKARRADYVIDNSNGLGKTKSQVQNIWNELNQ